MKSKWLYSGGALLAGLFVTLCPFIPATKPFFFSITNFQAFAERITSVIGLMFTFMSIYIHFAFSTIENSIEGHLKTLQSNLRNIPDVSYVESDQFYDDFLHAARSARTMVCIAYFAPFPPDLANKPRRNKYYKGLESLISKSNGRITFRRIIRLSKENKPWIRQLVEKFKDTPGFELAILKDAADDTEKMPHALSIQIIDDHLSWIVAIEDHEQVGTPRDIHIRSEVFAAGMSAYYKRLWSKSIILLDASRRLTPKGEAFLKTGEI